MRGPIILAVGWAVQLGAADARQAAVDVYYVPKLLDKFLHFSEDRARRSEGMHDLERQRLEAAIQETQDESSRAVITKTVEENELSRLEMRNVLNEMGNFVHSLKAMMGGAGARPESCADMTCGDDATCGLTRSGATCECDDGFVGDGFICEKPTVFLSKPLLPDSLATTQVADLTMSRLGAAILVAYRSKSDDLGYVMSGKVGPAHVEWSDPVPFSNGSSVFSPEVALIPEDRFVIAYRDADEKGTGFVVGGQVTHGDKLDLAIGSPLPFARMQSHAMSVVPLPGGKFAAFFNDRRAEGEEYGSALLGAVEPAGKAVAKGTFVFAESAVTRLTSVLLSQDSFAVAYRAPVDTSVDALTVTYNEANVVYGKVAGADIVFDPTPLKVEPAVTELWDRGLGVLTANRFMYAYQSGNEEKTKLAIVEVDKITHKMHVTSKKDLAQGFTPFARAVGLAYAPAAPRSFVLYEHRGMAKYSSCAVSSDGILSDCSDNTWSSTPVTSVSSVALGGGRVLFVYTNKDGSPFYQVTVLK